MKGSIIEYRNINDFRFNSFTVYVKRDEIIIRGILKSGASSKYMLIRRN